MSLAVKHNLPIFYLNPLDSEQLIEIPNISYNNDLVINNRFYIKAFVGFETYLGVMNTSPRKDYFAYIKEYKGKSGQFKIGRLDYADVTKEVKNDSICIEVIPNEYGDITDFTEFVPRIKSGYLVFTTKLNRYFIEEKRTFIDWVRKIKLNENE